MKIDLPPGDAAPIGHVRPRRLPGAARQGLAVPAAAVVRRGQLASVFVVDADNHARLRLVNASEPADGHVEIRAGLRSR